MQPPAPLPPRSRRIAAVALITLAGLVAAVSAVGCGGSEPPPLPPQKPFAGTALTVACADPAFAKELQSRTAGWAGRTGAKVSFTADPAAADVAVIPPADLGTFAARGALAPVPEELLQPNNPLQWNAILPVYGRVLNGWGGKLLGLPVAGDGYVLVYRADRFGDDKHRSGYRSKIGRDLAPPATWDDLADVAGYFHEQDGSKPTLAPLPADPARLATLFYQIAASADRKAVTLGTGTQLGETALTFQFDLTTGKPRIAGPGFAAAAGWLARTKPLRPAAASDDPVAALDAGGAVAAVLSLGELGRLPRDESGTVSKRFGVAKVPGSLVVFDKAGQREELAGTGNYVPYLGAGAKMAVVFGKSQSTAAAWDLVAEMAGVSVGLATMGNPALGAGPFRTEYVEENRSQVWLRYGFDAAGTRSLANAVRHYLSLEVGNSAVVLRVPPHAELTAALANELQRAGTGETPPADALKAAAAEWEKIAAKSPEFKAWLRAGAGLQ